MTTSQVRASSLPILPAPRSRPQPNRTRGCFTHGTAVLRQTGMVCGLFSLDAVSPQGQCQIRVLTLQAAPSRTRGTLRAHARYGLRCVVHPATPEQVVRGWKLFCLAPHAPPPPVDCRRSLADSLAGSWHKACLPHQFGLSTCAGTEAVSRLLRAATETSPRATVLSVDAVGAVDHVARGSMLGAVLARPALQPLLPYARQFYGMPSTYTRGSTIRGRPMRFVRARAANKAIHSCRHSIPWRSMKPSPNRRPARGRRRSCVCLP